MKTLQYLYMSALGTILMCNCGKDSDNSQPPPVTTTCFVAQQSGIESLAGRDTVDEISYGRTFKKTYGDDGKVSRVELEIEAIGKRRYVCDFYFAYSDGKADVTGTFKSFKRNQNDELYMTASQNVDFDIIFNSDGYATQCGISTLEYSGGKLASGVTDLLSYAFEYDDHGNVSRIKQFTSYGYRSLTYEYDYSKTATDQIYLTSGSWLNTVDFNLLEVMGWIPVEPKHLRTVHWLRKFREETGIDSTHAKFAFSDHVLTDDGKLTSFRMNDGNGIDQVVTNTWLCK